MKSQSPASTFIVAIEMTALGDNSRQFGQSWIPPGRKTQSVGSDRTVTFEPWLYEFAYIYSGPWLDLIEPHYSYPPKARKPKLSHRHEPNQNHVPHVDEATMDEASNISVEMKGLPCRSTAAKEILLQPALRSSSELLSVAVSRPSMSLEPPPMPSGLPRIPFRPPLIHPELPPTPSEPPPRPPEPPPRPPEPPPRSPEPPPRPPEFPSRPLEPPLKRQHSGSIKSSSNPSTPDSSYINCGIQDSRKPRSKKRFMGCVRGKSKAKRHNGTNEPANITSDPIHSHGDGCSTSISCHEPHHQYDAYYHDNSKETPLPPESVPRQSSSSLLSKIKTSLTRSSSGDQTSSRNGKDSKSGRDSRSTTRSISSRLKQHVVEPLTKLTRHGSKSSHRSSSDSSLPSSSCSAGSSIENYPASGSSTLQRATPSSTSSLCSHSAYKKQAHCALDLQVIPEGPPRPFQCTFCFEQCDNRPDWMKHERSHFPEHGWTCMINSQDHIQYDGRILCDFCGLVDKSHRFSQHNVDACVNSMLEDRTFSTESDIKYHLLTTHNHDNTTIEDMQAWEWPTCMDNWFWSCGFCDTVLLSWDKRQDHIADEHFENECTLALWDPLTSPYPRSRQSSTLVRGFPRWEQSTLLKAIKQPAISDFINRVGQARPPNQCRLCRITFSTFEDLSQHMTQWHGHPKSWSCPNTIKGATFKDFFGPGGSCVDNDICFYCRTSFSNNQPNWSLRKRHLEEEHHFNECTHEKFFKLDQFCRHLANTHKVDMDSMNDFTLACEREDDRTPATGLVGE
ncbi:hypothetical protein AOQ84DRAFT_375351 [Glonium stellatum]|uniref:C2H2-type domain-containing protein n=1 Tax=Glonium stellatum TaxID=574774 RepID=A0A8E2JUC9_9PEZI|nr:hypothetical protein AOQ84DRAFT_375351 [Glonium stellatum]